MKIILNKPFVQSKCNLFGDSIVLFVSKRYYPRGREEGKKIVTKALTPSSSFPKKPVSLHSGATPVKPLTPYTSGNSSNRSPMGGTPSKNFFHEEQSLSDRASSLQPGLKTPWGFFKQKNPTEDSSSPKTMTKSVSGKEVETSITSNTTISDLSDTTLFDELSLRELVNKDPKTETIFKDENGNNHVVGSGDKGYKLSQAGIAYHNQVKASNDDPAPLFKLPEKFSLRIAIPPQPSADTLIKTGIQKHLLLVVDEITGKIFAIAYLTGKNSGTFINKEQFKAFQNRVLNTSSENQKTDVGSNVGDSLPKVTSTPIIPTPMPAPVAKNVAKDVEPTSKSQQVAVLNVVQQMQRNTTIFVQNDKSYLEQPHMQEALQRFIRDLSNKFVKDFNPIGVTREDALNMCLAFDQNVKKKKNHPLTEDQIKQQLAAKEKQKVENEKKKLAKQHKQQHNDEVD